jgi:hypothetical protein
MVRKKEEIFAQQEGTENKVTYYHRNKFKFSLT